jgi:hypothetical protein
MNDGRKKDDMRMEAVKPGLRTAKRERGGEDIG